MDFMPTYQSIPASGLAPDTVSLVDSLCGVRPYTLNGTKSFTASSSQTSPQWIRSQLSGKSLSVLPIWYHTWLHGETNLMEACSLHMCCSAMRPFSLLCHKYTWFLAPFKTSSHFSTIPTLC